MRHLGNSKWLIVAKSVVDSRCPELKGFVRAELVVGGYIITPSSDNPNTSIVTYITQANLNGYIPQSIVKIAMVNQPLCIDGIRKIIEKEVHKYNIPLPSSPPPTVIENSQQKQNTIEDNQEVINEDITKSQLEEGEEEEVLTTQTSKLEEDIIVSQESTSNTTSVSVIQRDTTNEELCKSLSELVSSSKVLHTGLVYILNYYFNIQ